MIDMTKSVTITRSGVDILTQGDHPTQLFTFGKVLMLKRDTCIVLVAATKKKVSLPLTFPAVVDGVTYHANVEAEAPAAAPAKPARAPRAEGAETKISMCRRIFNEMQGGVIGGAEKAAIVARFVSEANCTPAGANTYFITCMKG